MTAVRVCLMNRWCGSNRKSGGRATALQRRSWPPEGGRYWGSSGGGGEEFGEAEDAAVVAGFTLDIVYAGPVGLGFFGWGCNARDGDFDFDAIVQAEEIHLARCGAIVVKAEAEFAGGDDGGFELLDNVVGEAGGVGEDAHGATCSGGEAFVVVEGEAKVERIFRHGYWLLAQETSQASRQSGQ
jgi:hypothetical protein